MPALRPAASGLGPFVAGGGFVLQHSRSRQIRRDVDEQGQDDLATQGRDALATPADLHFRGAFC